MLSSSEIQFLVQRLDAFEKKFDDKFEVVFQRFEVIEHILFQAVHDIRDIKIWMVEQEKKNQKFYDSIDKINRRMDRLERKELRMEKKLGRVGKELVNI